MKREVIKSKIIKYLRDRYPETSEKFKNSYLEKLIVDCVQKMTIDKKEICLLTLTKLGFDIKQKHDNGEPMLMGGMDYCGKRGDYHLKISITENWFSLQYNKSDWFNCEYKYKNNLIEFKTLDLENFNFQSLQFEINSAIIHDSRIAN